MKKTIIVLIVLVLAGIAAYAASTDINVEELWNKVFDSSTNTIKVVGQ